VRRLVEAAEVVTASVVAYPEARAALARRRRERSLTAADLRRAKTALEAPIGLLDKTRSRALA
jgi:hypothetical protein